MAVIGLGRQPGTNQKRERSIGFQLRKDMLKSRFQLRRAGNRPSFAYPQSGQAEGSQRHCLHVAGRQRELVGPLEIAAACVQVAVRVQRAISAG